MKRLLILAAMVTGLTTISMTDSAEAARRYRYSYRGPGYSYGQRYNWDRGYYRGGYYAPRYRYNSWYGPRYDYRWRRGWGGRDRVYIQTPFFGYGARF
jgi:hypothetical protein